MATDEVSKPPNLPSYSEMVLAAISALDEKAGSSRTAISKYIDVYFEADSLREAFDVFNGNGDRVIAVEEQGGKADFEEFKNMMFLILLSIVIYFISDCKQDVFLILGPFNSFGSQHREM